MTSVDVLGHVVVDDGTGGRPVSGRRAQILAVLAAADGRWVSSGQLAEEVWGDELVRSGVVHTNVSRCRSLLGDAGDDLLQSEAGRYRLALTAHTSDKVRFEEGWARVMALEAEQSLAPLLVEADAIARLWRGPPFAGVDVAGRVEQVATRLTGGWIRVIETAANAAMETDELHAWSDRLALALDTDPWNERVACLLSRCHLVRGDRTEALRVLNRFRSSLIEAGLSVTGAVQELERELLGASPWNEPAPPPTQSFIGRQRLAEAEQMIREHRHAAARDAAFEAISPTAGGLTLADRALGWTIVAMASDSLGEPLQSRRASCNAIRLAAEYGSSSTFRWALQVSLRSTVPGEPNRAIIDILSACPDDHPDRAWIDSALGGHRAMSYEEDALAAANEDLEKVLHRCRRADDATLRMALEATVRARAAHPEAEYSLALADEWVDRCPPGEHELSSALMHRVNLQISMGNRDAVEASANQLAELGTMLDSLEPLAAAWQVRAAVSMASGRPDDADAEIETGSAIAAEHPILQEVSMIQRWWLMLEQDPEATVRLIAPFAELGVRPGYEVMLAYSHLRAGDLERAQLPLRDFVAQDGQRILGPARGAVLAGFAEIAVATGDRDAVRVVLAQLLRFDGQLINTIGRGFVMGAAARFIGLCQAALDQPRMAAASFERAIRLEHRFGASALVAATERVAATAGVELPRASRAD